MSDRIDNIDFNPSPFSPSEQMESSSLNISNLLSRVSKIIRNEIRHQIPPSSSSHFHETHHIEHVKD